MIGNILFLLVTWGVAGFLANRLYVIVCYRAIQIKGVRYSRAETPTMYWVQLAVIVVGFLLVACMALVAALGIFGVLA